MTGADGREPCGLQRGHRILLLLFMLFFMKVKEESEKVGLKLNRLVSNRERSTSRLYIVTLLI